MIPPESPAVPLCSADLWVKTSPPGEGWGEGTSRKSQAPRCFVDVSHHALQVFYGYATAALDRSSCALRRDSFLCSPERKVPKCKGAQLSRLVAQCVPGRSSSVAILRITLVV